MGDGTKENPYTREDVLRLKKENSGTAEGLNLSGKFFEEGIDLSKLDLSGIILKEAHLSFAHLEEAFLIDADLEVANLMNAHLEGTHLLNAHLERANLVGVNIKMANLSHAHLEGADLWGAYLEGAYLAGVKLSFETMLENADWGNHVLGEEKDGLFDQGVATYRQLQVWYTNAGYADIAAKIYYREKEAARKGAKRRRDRLSGWLSWAFFGHGEEWKRILIWIASFILVFALVYFAIDTLFPNWGTLQPDTFLNSLYYSAVSFTALGYGSWAPQPTGWIKGFGAFEAIVGVSMIALLLVTFVRKWTR